MITEEELDSPIASFPEELLERILALVVIAPSTPQQLTHRAAWHSTTTSSSTSTPTTSPSKTKPPRGRIAPLLVSRTFYRIALPLFYHTIPLPSPAHAAALLHTLATRPSLTCFPRTLLLLQPGALDAEVLRALPRLEVLHVTLPTPTPESFSGWKNQEPMRALCGALREVSTLRAMVVRKDKGTYLSQPTTRALLKALAGAVRRSDGLETFTTTFPLSTDPALAPLTSALAAKPLLHTLTTPIPAVPSSALAYAAVAENPALRCVRFSSSSCDNSSALSCNNGNNHTTTVLSTSLFLTAARAWPRLGSLIRAGTAITATAGSTTAAASSSRARASTTAACAGVGVNGRKGCRV
ncbi:hypothetical protein R3P38DRAFT_3256465 [Favolaschia claudopus]|uniref:F-box domain-containing protein n=1 Tax=Favolaschia claudopus TaxID=2862362 RepID=A0AAW0DCK5_9AGAR